MLSWVRGVATSANTGAKAATKVVQQPAPRTLSTARSSLSTTTTGVAKEAAEQSRVFTPQRVLLGICAVGTGALYVSGALADGCASILGEGNCELLDAPRQVVGGIFGGISEGLKGLVMPIAVVLVAGGGFYLWRVGRSATQ
jgi:hypothetical protein